MTKLLVAISLLLSLDALGASGRTLNFDVQEGGRNQLVNPSFDRGSYSQGWTITTASGSVETSTIQQGAGKQAAKLTFSSSTGDITQTMTPVVPFDSQNMEAGCAVSTTLTTIQVCAIQGGNEFNCQNVDATGKYRYYPATFVGASSGNIGVRVKTTASTTGNVFVDDCYVGPARNTQQLSQAQYLGDVTITGCAAAWSTTSTTYAAFSTQTGCSYAVTGSLLAPATNVPGFQIPSLGAGVIEVKYAGNLGQTGANNAVIAYFQLTDGTRTSNEQPSYNSAGNVAVGTGNADWKIQETTALSNVTFSIQGKVTSATGSAGISGTTSQPGVFSVWFFPSQQQSGYRADSTPASWSGYQNGISGGCSVASVTFADLSSCTSISTTQITSRNIVCSQAASSAAGVTCTLPRAGIYQINVKANLQNSGNNFTSARLVDGSSTIIDPGTTVNASATNETAWSGGGSYNVASAGSVTFKIQLAGGGTASIANGIASGSAAITWDITEKDAPMPAPYFVGSVTSGSSGTERIERVSFSGNSSMSSGCGSSPCTMAQHSGGVSSVTRAGTGIYDVIFPAGTFSAIPTCTPVLDVGASAAFYCFYNYSASSVTDAHISCTNQAESVGVDAGAHVICMGPH